MNLRGSENIATEKVEGSFEKVSTDIFYYLQLGLITTTDISIYIKYLELYNPNYGYAFPTLYDMQDWMNLSRSSILNANKRLIKVGLLKQGKGRYKNNLYVPLQPLNKKELSEQVPEAVEKLKIRQAKIARVEKSDWIRFDTERVNHTSSD